MARRIGFKKTPRQKLTITLSDMAVKPSVKDPTVTLMTMPQVQAYSKQGFKIAFTTPVESEKTLLSTIKQALKMSSTGKVNFVKDGHYIVLKEKGDDIQPLKTLRQGHHGLGPLAAVVDRHIVGHVSAGFEVKKEVLPDGTYAIVIITPTEEIPPYLVKHEVRKQEGAEEKNEPVHIAGTMKTTAGHTFLKPPHTDEELINAMTVAARELLNDEQTGHLKWREGDNYYIKEYTVHHLLVCLFFYIYVNNLCSSSNFFYRQRSRFHEYYTKNNPERFKMCSERYFRDCIQKLTEKSCGLDEYLLKGIKPTGKWEKGMFSLECWYALYQRAAEQFGKVLETTVQKP